MSTDRTRSLRTALATGIPFGVLMGLFLAVQQGTVRGLFGGAVSGVLFGAAMAAFTEAQRRRMQVAGGELDGEPVLHQGAANHWMGIESRGGWLVLTPSRLVFRSHGKNVQNAPFELAVAAMAAVEPARSLGIVPNGLHIRDRHGETHRFVVSGRREWVAAIESARMKARTG